MYARHYNVSEPNHRKLIWLAKAKRLSVETITADTMLNTILDEFWKANYPELDDLIKARADIDENAVTSINQRDALKAHA